MLAKHSPPPSTSPPQAPADNQKTTETMPLHTGGTVLSPDEMSFDDLWDKAAKYFEDVCGKSLRDGNIRTFDDVEKQIEKQNQLYSDSDDKSKNRWEKTKGMGLETLKYLRALLGVASSASSVTPFPLAAEMTSRALDFVLSVPQQNHDYNEAVDKVFPHVSTALAEFKIYRKIDNKPLLPEIHHVLGCFVRLCALVVKHHQGGKRALIKGVLNRALRIDDELDQQLVEFNQAMQSKHYLQATITLSMLEKVQEVTGQTNERVNALYAEQDRAKILRNIGDYLGIPPTVNIDRRSTQTRQDISEKCFEKTGQWIWKHRDYTIWTGTNSKAKRTTMPHVLLVLGAKSTGKTCTCAQIIQHLEQMRNRTYIAHYFFPAEGALKKASDRKTIAWALRYMAFQIARVDATVRNSLDKACGNESVAFRRDIGSSKEELHELWKSFGIALPGSSATYYLVFDGLENLTADEVDALFGFVQKAGPGPMTTRNLRIILSGKPEQFNDRSMFDKVLKITMGDDSQEDMQIIVHEELARKRVLEKCYDVRKQSDARKLILDKLPSKVKGNYAELHLWLDRIAGAFNNDTPLDSLAELLDRPTQVYEVVIDSLERTLTAKEIDKLNELLKHIIFRQFPPTMKQLEAVMRLHFNETASVEGIDTMVRNRYSSILKIEQDVVQVQEGFEKYLAEKAKTSSSEQESLSHSPSTISMALTLNHVGRKRAAEYFWNLTQMAMQPNFTFDFTNPVKKDNQRQGQIAVDEFEAHLAIVKHAFKNMDSEPRVDHQSNTRYLVEWLPHHLFRLRELENQSHHGVLLAHQQREIGENLYKLFTDGSVFQLHKSAFERVYWTSFEMETLQEWLVDSAVRRQDKEWFKNVLSARNVIEGYLKEFIRWVITEFLRDRTWDASMAYRWIEEFMEKDSETISLVEEPINAEFSGKWAQVSEWCRKALDLTVESLDSLWYERLAKAASLEDGYELHLSIPIYRCAIGRANPSWLCYRDYGIIQHRQGQAEEAMKNVKKALSNAKASNADPKPSESDITELNLLLGGYAYETGSMESAETYYTSACDKGDTDQALKGLLGCLKIKLNTLSSQEMRIWLRGRLCGDDQQGDMCGVLELMAGDPDHHNLFPMMFSVFKKDLGMLQKVVTIMASGSHGFERPDNGVAKASGLANNSTEQGTDGILLYYAGVAAYGNNQLSNGPGSTFDAISLWVASRDELETIRSDNAIIIRSNASAALARHYFQLMLSNDEYYEVYKRKLEDLKPDDWKFDDLFNNDEVVGWLVSINTIRGQMQEVQKLLKPRLRKAISILSDDIPENDIVGLFAIHMATAACKDLKNAAIALSLVGQPDLVTDALLFRDEDKYVPEGINGEQLWDRYNNLAERTISIAMAKVPDAAAQSRRIQFAKLYIEKETEALKTPENDIMPNDEERATIMAAHQLIKDRLHRVDTKKPEIPIQWSCDGRTEDGKQCKKQSDFGEEFYHCLYCWQRDFCRDCLVRLRDPNSNVITVCNGGHEWMLTPPQGSSFYLGTRAKTVRKPSSVKPISGDRQILEARYDQDTEGVGSEMTTKEWIHSIRDRYLQGDLKLE